MPALIKKFVQVRANPGDKLVTMPWQDPVIGYYQLFGVTAESIDQMLVLIGEHLQEELGSRIVEVADEWEPDLKGQDSDVAHLVGDLEAVGIWYTSGRAFFRTEDDVDEPDEVIYATTLIARRAISVFGLRVPVRSILWMAGFASALGLAVWYCC